MSPTTKKPFALFSQGGKLLSTLAHFLTNHKRYKDNPLVAVVRSAVSVVMNVVRFMACVAMLCCLYGLGKVLSCMGYHALLHILRTSVRVFQNSFQYKSFGRSFQKTCRYVVKACYLELLLLVEKMLDRIGLPISMFFDLTEKSLDDDLLYFGTWNDPRLGSEIIITSDKDETMSQVSSLDGEEIWETEY